MFDVWLLHFGCPNSITTRAVTSPGDRILPVITPNLLGEKGREVNGTVLLDSGAEISIIREDIAQQLQLKGKYIVVNLTRVGSEKECHTKLYTLCIHKLTSHSVLKVEAISLPSISEDVASINIQELDKLFIIVPGQLKRSGEKIDLLIGVDIPNLHTGEVRKKGNLLGCFWQIG